MPELSDCCLAMQFFSDGLLAVACRCAGVEAAEGLVLSLVGGASVALLEVESRCEGLEAELGDVSEGIVWLCAITIAPGARVIKAANKSVFRGLMRSSPVIERAASWFSTLASHHRPPSEARVGSVLRLLDN